MRYFYSILGTAPTAYTALIMTKPVKPVKFSRPENFEAALTELEAIVVEMEAGQLPLEASLVAHKRGTELLQYCQSKLQDAQQQVRLFEANALKNFSPSGIDDR
jgi:exodeoxyribonuclease VII small subunit